MPIRKFIEDQSFDPEQIDSMSRALFEACETLGFRVGDDDITRRIAKRIIEVAREGERDTERLKAAALKTFQN